MFNINILPIVNDPPSIVGNAKIDGFTYIDTIYEQRTILNNQLCLSFILSSRYTRLNLPERPEVALQFKLIDLFTVFRNNYNLSNETISWFRPYNYGFGSYNNNPTCYYDLLLHSEYVDGLSVDDFIGVKNKIQIMNRRMNIRRAGHIFIKAYKYRIL